MSAAAARACAHTEALPLTFASPARQSVRQTVAHVARHPTLTSQVSGGSGGSKKQFMQHRKRLEWHSSNSSCCKNFPSTFLGIFSLFSSNAARCFRNAFPCCKIKNNKKSHTQAHYAESGCVEENGTKQERTDRRADKAARHAARDMDIDSRQFCELQSQPAAWQRSSCIMNRFNLWQIALPPAYAKAQCTSFWLYYVFRFAFSQLRLL